MSKSIANVAKTYKKKIELVVEPDQKQWDPNNFVVKSDDFSAYGSECPEQALENFEQKMILLSAIEKDIGLAREKKKATEDFIATVGSDLIKIYDSYQDRDGDLHVDTHRELDPIEFFDTAISLLEEMAQKVKNAKSMVDMNMPILNHDPYNHGYDRGYECTIFDVYSEMIFSNLIRAVENISDDNDHEFDTIVV